MPQREGQSEVGCKLKGSGCGEITSSFVAPQTNLLHPNSLTHADGEVASAGFK